MGASKADLFGDGTGAQAAEPDSYGEPAPGFRLPGPTHLGRVVLQVSDLGRSIIYYETVLGLRVLTRSAGRAELAPHHDETVLVELREGAGAMPSPGRSRLGLYHFAILLPDRAALGRLISHLVELDVRAGSSDHLVSEALYLRDPDNLGIEVYSDRPRSSWRRVGRELMMATDPLDFPGLLREAAGAPWTGMPARTVMGHVHLHVGDIARGSAFYSDALGFDRMISRYPGALFLGAGGYHHHVGTNTWAGPDATAPAPDEAQLLEWTIRLPDAEGVAAAETSLAKSGFGARRDGQGSSASLITQDPWGTSLRLEVAPARHRA